MLNFLSFNKKNEVVQNVDVKAMLEKTQVMFFEDEHWDSVLETAFACTNKVPRVEDRVFGKNVQTSRNFRIELFKSDIKCSHYEQLNTTFMIHTDLGGFYLVQTPKDIIYEQ